MPDNDIFEDKDIKEGKPVITDDKPVIKDDAKPDADKLLASIVNEDGTPKYGSQEEALKALSHAQEHIKTLETDNAVLKDKDTASDKLDELLDTIKKSNESGKGEKDTSAMKPEDVLGIVKEYFDDTKASETRTNNINTVTTVFKERFGKDASDKLYEKADDLGFSRDEINSMIANNPNAALKVLGIEAKKPANDIITHKPGFDTSEFRTPGEEAPKSAMALSSAKDLTDNWNASKARTLKRLGIEA